MSCSGTEHETRIQIFLHCERCFPTDDETISDRRYLHAVAVLEHCVFLSRYSYPASRMAPRIGLRSKTDDRGGALHAWEERGLRSRTGTPVSILAGCWNVGELPSSHRTAAVRATTLCDELARLDVVAETRPADFRLVQRVSKMAAHACESPKRALAAARPARRRSHAQLRSPARRAVQNYTPCRQAVTAPPRSDRRDTGRARWGRGIP